MNRILVVLFVLTFSFSCKNNENKKTADSVKIEYQEIKKDEYSLNKPTKNIKAVLVLFGGFPENVEDIKREFEILENAKKNNISVLYMNYNRKLWIEQNELEQLSKRLQSIFKENKLPVDNIYVGGFSSGGNIALLISNFMTNENSNIIPKGVFIGDSPIDLAELYHTAEKNIERNLSNSFAEESKWLLETLGKEFGNPNNDISKYELYSVFTSKTNNIDNLKNLKNTKIRLYTEPDTLWWKEQTMAKYEEMNAYHIKQLSELLNKSNFKNVEYIPTENKGYRADGEKNPHSWSIIDRKELINWMLNK
ncbi:conserved hypothetical protein [Formosa agariphila KMM 3901]|uniref:Uncharacterized protein n=1 Tax=Formosa agariphila (strain DSM 15362 / KCTC 12365 / LMG 23005 / KMM 3901 / M-2Alg 35-1) TaxID=1347342 RepID=T2KRY7_FORAG|nr:hypothetical protein [Formosa agariphila]CDF80829.1 conserved hypothetical protein [Formosa agariphila KMM 3901]